MIFVLAVLILAFVLIGSHGRRTDWQSGVTSGAYVITGIGIVACFVVLLF